VKKHEAMSEILDYEAEPQVRKSIFSLISLLLGILAWTLFGVVIISISHVNISEGLRVPQVFPILIRYILLAGLIATVMSFVRKEPSKGMKRGGLILNLLMTLLSIAANIWVNNHGWQ